MYRNRLQTNVILSATIIAIGILLLSLSYSQSLSKFKDVISRIMTPLQVNIYSLVEPLFINQPIAPEELVNLNATLTAETALLRSENIRLSEAVYERDMLAALLNYTKLDNVHTYISAHVSGKDTSSVWPYVISA
ncbi:MAG: hypothetical protein VX199_01885, partial [Chloroflexota bacterium]|nr:hypothetical protein [Chloroflexota bacterium]